MRTLAELSAVEIRVLGVLMEKEQTTPEYYPLTVNSITAACNQKTNRFPVMQVDEDQVLLALESLGEDQLVASVGGTRADHWKHRAELVWKLNPRTQALLTLLFLRGPQTPGELRNRSERMHAFASVEEVEGALAELAASEQALVFESPRQPGQKERRWSTTTAAAQPAAAAGIPERPDLELAERVAALERRVEALEAELAQVKARSD